MMTEFIVQLQTELFGFLRCSLLCDVTQRRLAVSYRRFGTVWTDRLSLNLGNRLPINALQWMPEIIHYKYDTSCSFNLLKPGGHVMHQQFNL